MIYVVRTKDSIPAFIKIGYAKKSLASRIRDLQTACPHTLELVFAKNGEIEEERKMQKALDGHGVRGEWFSWNEEVAKILKIPFNARPIHPENPGFLTPRQKQINHLFRRGSNYSIDICTMALFLARHQYTMRDLVEFPVRKAKFVILETTRRELHKANYGIESLCSEETDLDKTQLFICSKPAH